MEGVVAHTVEDRQRQAYSGALVHCYITTLRYCSDHTSTVLATNIFLHWCTVGSQDWPNFRNLNDEDVL